MFKTRILSPFFGLSLAALSACDPSAGSLQDGLDDETLGTSQSAITDVAHSPVERQSIGNCWLYSQATWVESMTLGADPASDLDISQSYWTYWHWFDQVTGFRPPSELQTGGFQFTANAIVRDRGLMNETEFVGEDSLQEMSGRQADALAQINQALAQGEFNDVDGQRAREIFDDAWGLSAEVRAQLDTAFGVDGEATLRQGADLTGTQIVDPALVPVRYTELVAGETVVRDASLLDAIIEWQEASYPFDTQGMRRFEQRVQRALHDNQPVVITWNVDFNALENQSGEFQGSFNLATLEAVGRPGGQGGHMTVLEDYEAVTQEFGLLEAGVTLDPEQPADAARLAAALDDSTEIKFFRTKKSWGANRPDREFAEGFPGYHDLYVDYLNGPFRWCPDATSPTNETCMGETRGLRAVMLPPGY